ncbi:probable LRR receptor-like serine/threonine-protein kinase At2g28960 [Syzygium oleosum]|uniref:probable LRR receptor-like serine/threonine-protein kinase At2g28960 n=1 Tax=Syzygium oleosum TaxID=219896 RepID=UPI0024B9A0F0|nr:probable LRR receptor-like serine/threonine-protein kinase At2g28960 [Syzygium oleosum]
MANSCRFHKLENEEQLSFILIISVVFTTMNLVSSQTAIANCSLDGKVTLYDINRTCQNASWGGFINHDCCGVSFDEYLYALGQQANLTGQIFLGAMEQKNCLASMNATESNVLGCGIEKLTRGAGGCSDYLVTDVVTRLGDSLRNLRKDCDLGQDQDGSSKQGCSACLATWEEIGKSSANGTETAKLDADLCRFAALITLTGKKSGDKNWVRSVYKCLGEPSGLHVDEKDSINKKSPGIKSRTGLWIVIAGLVGIVIVIAIAAWIWFKKRVKVRVPKEKEDSPKLPSEDSSGLKISIKEVYLATNNLNPTKFIGQGIAGKVYRGILSNGQDVAIKHIISEGHTDTYVREVASLSDVRHPNLVALLGYCENEDECFLVYELCHNGNLSEWLFGKDKVLSWIQRLKIAIDSARGLWFLHTYPEGCIVHRDIKPTNILISANFEAKLSDFGLSKVMDVDQSFVSSEVRGTFGYVDPEYRRNRHVNASGDVYSFGIAKVLTKGGNIAEFADPKLNGEYLAEAFDLVLKLALSCTGFKQQRPSMEQVVSRLEKALDMSTEGKSTISRSERERNLAYKE